MQELLDLIGQGESSGIFAPRKTFPERDVWIGYFGRPTQFNVDKFYTMLTQTRKRMIVNFSCNSVNLGKWQQVINETLLPTFESMNEHTYIIYKDA